MEMFIGAVVGGIAVFIVMYFRARRGGSGSGSRSSTDRRSQQ